MTVTLQYKVEKRKRLRLRKQKLVVEGTVIGEIQRFAYPGCEIYCPRCTCCYCPRLRTNTTVAMKAKKRIETGKPALHKRLSARIRQVQSGGGRLDTTLSSVKSWLVDDGTHGGQSCISHTDHNTGRRTEQ